VDFETPGKNNVRRKIDHRLALMRDMLREMKDMALSSELAEAEICILFVEKAIAVTQEWRAALDVLAGGSETENEENRYSYAKLADDTAWRLLAVVGLGRALVGRMKLGLTRSSEAQSTEVICSFCGQKKEKGECAWGATGKICRTCAVHVAHIFGIATLDGA
jgi:hypothetical protein